jgi:hypothetical protein
MTNVFGAMEKAILKPSPSLPEAGLEMAGMSAEPAFFYPRNSKGRCIRKGFSG